MRWGAAFVFLLLLLILLAPWWGRPLAESIIRSALQANGWQAVELRVSALGASQAMLTAVKLQHPQMQVEIPEIALRYDLFQLLTKGRIHSAIVNEARVQALFANKPADLLGALLVADWPQSERLPFERIYISGAQIAAQPSAGLQPLQVNALLEHTLPTKHSAGTARMWANAQSPAPYAQLEIAFEANLREQTLKATLDGQFRDLPHWRALPLPPEALEVLSVVREELTLQGAASVQQRTLKNWMFFGQSPAAIYTAPNGNHVEALQVDFGVNVQGANKLDYGWLRAASGAASASGGSIEWQNLRAELKPGHYLNAHMDSALLRTDLPFVARELMPALRLNKEIGSLWQSYVWQASDLSFDIFSAEPTKSRPPFMRATARLQLGSLEYPWEKLEPLSPAFEAQLQRIPLLQNLTQPMPTRD